MGLIAAVVGSVVALCLGLIGAFAGAGPAGASPPVPAAATPSTVKPLIYPGGGLSGFGDAASSDPLQGVALNAPVVGMAPDRPDGGFWLASADGGVYAVGNAPFLGSMGGTELTGPVVGIAATPDGKGYWMVAIDGGIFTFGDAPFYGSMGGHHLNQPVVGMAPTPDGRGYWLVAADGGIFTFGDAQFYGSTGSMHLNAPIVGMAATPDGGGYWLVAQDGGIFTFGDAPFKGSLGGTNLQSGIVAMAASARGDGYWLLEWNGDVFAFGTAGTYGHPTGSPTAAPYTGLVPTADGKGYWLLEPDGFDYSFANPPPVGGYPSIVAAAASQIQPDPDSGYFCNPYGPCEAWCALFATWAWQAGGVPIPSYGFTGDIYDWAAASTQVLAPTARPVAGDAVLYGTGPQNAATSVHVGIVAQVWPDGAIDTVEGDAGPGVTGHLAVVVNGPFLPTDSVASGNYPVYAFAQP